MVDNLQITIRNEIIDKLKKKWLDEHPLETEKKPTQMVRELIYNYINNEKEE